MGLAEWWSDLKRKVLKESARQAVNKAADSALDDLESALLGDVGAADQILKDQSEVDPLDRIRTEHKLQEKTDKPKKKRTKADAQAELERLKAEMDKK